MPGVPQVIYRGTEAGLMDIVLHPNFAQNRWIYFSYHKPIGNNLASNAVGRAVWDGKALTDVKEIFLSDDVDTEVSRLTFGRDGMLYMSIGGPGTGPPPSLDRPAARQRLRRQADSHARRWFAAGGQSVRRQGRTTSRTSTRWASAISSV